MPNPKYDGRQKGDSKPLLPLMGFIQEMLDKEKMDNVNNMSFDISVLGGKLSRIPGKTRDAFETRLAVGSDKIMSTLTQNSVLRLAYFINYPVFNDILWKPLAVKIARSIEAHDKHDDVIRWYQRNYDLWKVIGLHIDTASPLLPERAASGLIELLRTYIDDTNKLVAVIGQSVVWLLLTGSDTAPRILNALKTSWRNTLSAAVHGIPLLKVCYHAILEQLKVLAGVDENGTLSVALPVYNNFATSYVTQPIGSFEGKNGVITDPDTEYADIIPGIYNRVPIIGDFMRTDNFDAYWGQIWHSPYRYSGALADIMKTCVEYYIDLFKDRWKGIFLDAHSPLLRFFTNEFPVLDGTLQLNDIQKTISSMPLFDIEKFSARCMRYDSLPGPRLRPSFYTPNNHPILMANDIRVDRKVETQWASFATHAFTYQWIYENIRASEDGRLYEPNLIPEADAVLPGTALTFPNFGPYYMWSERGTAREDLDALRDIPHYESSRMSAVMPDQYAAIPWLDGVYFMYESLEDYNTMHPGGSTIEDPTNYDMTALAESSPGTFLPFGVFGPVTEFSLIRDAALSFTSHAVYDTESEKYVDVLKRSIEENGAFMIPEMIRNGYFMPQRLVTPTINRSDPAQCGFYLLTSVEDLRRVYADDFSSWYAAMRTLLTTAVTESSLHPNGAGSSVWSNNSDVDFGFQAANMIKDTLVFIGDGIHLNPRVAIDRLYSTSCWLHGSIRRHLAQFPVSIYSKSRVNQENYLNRDNSIKNATVEANGMVEVNNPDPISPDPADDMDSSFALHGVAAASMRCYPQYTRSQTHPTIFEILHPEKLFVDNFDAIVSQSSNMSRFISYALALSSTVAPEMDKSAYGVAEVARFFNSTRISPLNNSATTYSSKSIVAGMFNRNGVSKGSSWNKSNKWNKGSGGSRNKGGNRNKLKQSFSPSDPSDRPGFIPEINDGKDPKPIDKSQDKLRERWKDKKPIDTTTSDNQSSDYENKKDDSSDYIDVDKGKPSQNKKGGKA